jgi:hypothetical protein
MWFFRGLAAAFCFIAWHVEAHVLAGDAGNSPARSYSTAGWNIVESENFRFCSRGPLNISDSAVQDTERLRRELAEQWLGDDGAPDAWRPKCDILLHTTPAAYLRSVPGGEQTVGSSVIDTDGGRVVGRRVDLRADRPGWLKTALAHELTHVVLADRFPDGRLPAWADEGMAVLADTHTKQDAHSRDLRAAQSQRRAFRLVELFALNGYPSSDRQAAFYGQSASLVRYLIGQGTPAQFVRFVRAADMGGYETAVRDIYGLPGVRELERRWLQHLDVADAVVKN